MIGLTIDLDLDDVGILSLACVLLFCRRFNVLKSAPIDVVADVKSERVRTSMTSGFDFGDGKVFGFDFGCRRGLWIRMGSGARFDSEVGLGELGSVMVVCWIWWWCCALVMVGRCWLSFSSRLC
ncbi:hypothetical protein Ddye_021330 [Dipteronia dyeriana]|uniref:Uncharacterized protein n=1 Tax=Dipteronia dyeriana TaxID=168575 RepID=A0AAD9U2G9_9ROSI|nr:hypothetical protein Ddye_021330 [Dipteronia dyeriana]